MNDCIVDDKIPAPVRGAVCYGGSMDFKRAIRQDQAEFSGYQMLQNYTQILCSRILLLPLAGLVKQFIQICADSLNRAVSRTVSSLA